MKINRGNTAITRNKLSAPMVLLKNKLKNKTILDFGCGKGFDVEYLKSVGYDINGYEPFVGDKYKEYPNKHYDIVVCNYVLNVIEDIDERLCVVQQLKSLGDEVYITVRADKNCIKGIWNEYNDGYITSRNTFQKIYDLEKIYEEFGKVKIINSNSSYIMFKA